MSELKSRLKSDLTEAMRARDDVRLAAIRLALSAIAVAETAGDESVELTDAEVQAVLATEARKHHETADAFRTAGRPDRTERELAEAAVLEAYLPAALSDEQLADLVGQQVTAAAADGVTGMKAMGRVVSAVRASAGASADGAKIAAMVKAALGS
jgi:uncharacterized protein YqeY